MDVKERCTDCCYLVEGDNGEWICSDWDREISLIDNDLCEFGGNYRNIPREEKKAEAIRRMKALGYFDLSIAEFEKYDMVMTNEPPLYAHFYIDDERDGELKKWVDEFEEKNNALVYAVIHSLTTIGEMYSLLYVEDYKEEWKYFDEDYPYGIVMAYVINVDAPHCSEFGSMRVKLTAAAGLRRCA